MCDSECDAPYPRGPINSDIFHVNVCRAGKEALEDKGFIITAATPDKPTDWMIDIPGPPDK